MNFGGMHRVGAEFIRRYPPAEQPMPTPVIYQVRLIIKPELEAEFNAWYEGEYIPKLMRETPHFTAVRRYEGDFNGQRLYVTDYDCTTETLPLAIAEMRAPGRAEDNAAFY